MSCLLQSSLLSSSSLYISSLWMGFPLYSLLMCELEAEVYSEEGWSRTDPDPVLVMYPLELVMAKMDKMSKAANYMS